MGLLNSDYSEIKRQIDYVDSHFIDCKTKDEFYNCFATYETLCRLYKMATGIDLFDLSGPIKLTAAVAEDSFRRQALNTFYDRFYENRGFSHDLFREVFFSGIDAYFNFLQADNDYLNHIPITQLASDIEGMQIIYSFFDSEFPEVKPIFDELLATGRIFDMGLMTNYADRDGFSFFNPIENVGNSFLRKPLRTLSDISSFVHEFAHIVDCDELSKNFPHLCAPINNGLRFDVEVTSCHYQLKFLEFCIRNNICREDALKELANNIGALLYHLENGFFVTLADEDDYSKLKFGSLTKRQYIKGLFRKDPKIDLPSYLADGSLDYVISIPETSSYAYGIALGCAIDSKEMYNKFIESRGEENFSKRLETVGITPESSARQLVKKIETLYT